MSMQLIRRLDVLGREIPEPGCPTCSAFEWQTGIVFLTAGSIDAEADTLSDDAEYSRPATCPACGAEHPIHTVLGGGLSWDDI